MADPAFHIPDVPRRWPRLLLWLSPLLPLALGAAAVVWQGNFVAERALRLALGEGTLSHRLESPSASGTVRLRDLQFGAPGSNGPRLSARRAEIEVGGWWWLLSNSVRQQRIEAPLARLRIRLEGVDVTPGFDPALGELAPAGLSGAPFESEGCPASVRFDATGLADAGVPPDNELRFDFQVDGTRLTTWIRYRLAGAAAIERRLDQQLPMPLSLLVVDQYPMRTTTERWQLEDLGFSRVRHRNCAERGELIALVDRHVEGARNRAAALGLAATDEAWALYRRYVRDGGTLQLQLRYPQPAPLDGWFDRPRPASLLALSEVELSREEQRVRFTPVDAYTDGLSGQSPKSVQPLQLAGTLWIDADKALVLLEPERAAPAAAPAIAEAPEPTGTEAADDAPDPPVQTAPPAAPPRAPVSGPSSRVPQPEGRLVVVGEQRIRRLEWAQLESRIGARLRITTRTGTTRVIELVAWTPAEITVRQRIGGGMAESRIQRKMVREVVEL